ncbi:MAG: hypothetical protein CYPHOPRED_005814 [Cyphobasidiales sp. Tagirdzhanova-0007]|nr:MAG: hypothetical protein CYPHOPRED_005814 [Cyphobasidiales sp. Tagirdzhanova-0007]
MTNEASSSSSSALLLGSATSEDSGPVHRLDLSTGQATVSLGPVVVNQDGTLSRVSN